MRFHTWRIWIKAQRKLGFLVRPTPGLLQAQASRDHYTLIGGNMRKSKIHLRFFVLIALLCMFVAQGPETTITATSITNSYSDEPVEVSISMGNTQPHEKLVGDNNWLDHLVVQAKNTSGKAVRYLEVKVMLPNGKSEAPQLSLPFIYGHPFPKSRETEALKTGAKVELRGSRMRCEEAKKQLARIGHSPYSINDLKTRVNVVIFDDGTAWFLGHLHHQDPNNHTRWIVNGQSSNSLALKHSPYNKASNSVAHKLASSLVPVQQPCGRYHAFDFTYCCTEDFGVDYYVASVIILGDPTARPSASATLATACCPQTPGACCSYYTLTGCPN